MSHKTNPIANRLPLTKQWRSKWITKDLLPYYVVEDAEIRRLITKMYGISGGIERVEIERHRQDIKLMIHTAKPGIVIGRSGQGIQSLRSLLQSQLQSFRDKNFLYYARTKNAQKTTLPSTIKIEIIEVKVPELHARLVADNLAYQIEKRAPYRRAIKQAIEKTMQKGARGMKISIAGRLGGSEIARHEKFSAGTVPLSTFRNDIDYAHADAKTSSYGTIGIKAWIYRGDRLAEALEPRTRREV